MTRLSMRWGLVLSVTLTFSAVAPCRAAVLTVTSFGDNGAAGQLRTLMNLAGAGDTIIIPAGTIQLAGAAGENLNASGDLDVTKNLSIQGAGAGLTIIKGGGDRVFDIRPGITATIAGLTVRDGATGLGIPGGGIINSGTLTLTNVVVTGNAAGALGGGIENVGTLTLVNVTVSGNQATGAGGGGGGIDNAGVLTLVNVTISGNQATGDGGGLFAFSSTATLNNVTVMLNRADSDNAGGGQGGGIFIDAGGTVSARNTIVSGNTVPDCSGTLSSLGSNLITTGCSGLQGTDITGQGANLAPLLAAGGPTPTHALLSGSPALDAGDGACAATDQRGVVRPQHGRCDIGAFERGGTAATATDFDGDGFADIVTGAGAGGGPHVRVFSGATGLDLVPGGFFAYAAGFGGGVRVATCDLNGDGVPDIVTGAGPGGGPHVRAFDGRTGAPLPGAIGSFFPYVAAFTGGVFVGCADVDGDGVPDIITGAGPGGGPHVQVFSGVDGSLIRTFFAYDPAFTGGVFVAP